MAWNIYLMHTKTGKLGPRVEGEFSWDLSMDDGNISLTLLKSAVPKLSTNTPYFSPWWGGAALFWDTTPIMAGPLVSIPEETQGVIKLGYKSVWSLLSRRTAVPDMVDFTHLNNADYKKNWRTDRKPTTKADVKEAIPIQEAEMYNKAYHTIAKIMVDYSKYKTGGELPIDTSGVPVNSNTDDDKLTWDDQSERSHYGSARGIDMQESLASKLQDLSSNNGGPDIYFQTMFDSNKYSIYWKMITGTSEVDPRIISDNTDVWDTTAAGSDIVDLSVQTSGSKMVTRVLVNDLGDNGTHVLKTNVAMLKDGYPMLESGISINNTKKAGKVKEVADKTIAYDSVPRRQLSGSLRVDSTIHPLGSYWPGDIITLVTKDWISIPNGERKARIESISGDSSMNVSISFSEETPIYEEAKWTERVESSI